MNEKNLFSNKIFKRNFLIDEKLSGNEIEADRFINDFSPELDDYIISLFERVENPNDPFEIRELFLSRIECELETTGNRSSLKAKWLNSKVRRNVTSEEIYNSGATIRFIKELFNSFFRDDLYGTFESDENIIFSSGSLDATKWGLENSLKECLYYGVKNDLYGYSDSCGRRQVREAIADLENSKIKNNYYNHSNVAVTLGATMALNAVSDFIYCSNRNLSTSSALCGIPNYPPLVESISRRMNTQLIPMNSVNGVLSLTPLIDALRPTTPVVFIQTIINPTGERVPESEIERLIKTTSPSTIIILDECHEWLGESFELSKYRSNANVVRIASLSKNYSAPGLKIGWIIASDTFIKDFYEYASTSYGGPPSAFFTLIEFLARFEKWRLEKVTCITNVELNEFEASYGLSVDTLQNAYSIFLEERSEKLNSLIDMRDYCISKAQQFSFVSHSKYSINMAINMPSYSNSYYCFRDVLHSYKVALLPGVITFCFSKAIMRISTASTVECIENGFSKLMNYSNKKVVEY